MMGMRHWGTVTTLCVYSIYFTSSYVRFVVSGVFDFIVVVVCTFNFCCKQSALQGHSRFSNQI